MKRGEMRVGIMVDDEVNCLNVIVGRHRQVSFNHHGDYPSIFGDDWHVKTHMSSSDGTATGNAIENTGDLFVRYFRILGTREAGERLEPADHSGACDKACNRDRTSSEKRSTGYVVEV